MEEVLPKQSGHVKVNVAYIDFAGLAGEGHFTDTLELVDHVLAVATIQARVGSTFIKI